MIPEVKLPLDSIAANKPSVPTNSSLPAITPPKKVSTALVLEPLTPSIIAISM